MFREMRRVKQSLTLQEIHEILNECKTGILGVNGDDGYPYTVPVNYVLQNNSIFIHGAKSGHKIDSIKRSDKVSFSVISQDDIIPDKFDTHYRSVCIFGKARILYADSEIRSALELLVKKYSPGYLDAGKVTIERSIQRVCVIEIKIEQMTGKTALDLTQLNSQNTY